MVRRNNYTSGNVWRDRKDELYGPRGNADSFHRPTWGNMVRCSSQRAALAYGRKYFRKTSSIVRSDNFTALASGEMERMSRMVAGRLPQHGIV